MSNLPAGTITFLFSDVEGSTRLWEGQPAAMRSVMARHDALIRTCVERCGGTVVRERGEGDSCFAVFTQAAHALAAATAIQLHFHTEPWELESGLRVRIGIHTGGAELREHGYYGDAVNRCARVRALASGGQTLLSGVTRELVATELPPSVQLRDLGLHRLKDLQKPEEIFQLVHPQLENDFPPLKSLDYLPTNLPQQLTRFIGREEELQAVAGALAEHRLVTVVAPGGAGKTRLALQAAAEGLDRYRDGVWLAELAAVSEPQLVSQTVARALGVPLEPGASVLQTLQTWLREKELLLVLDNCEHLLPACVELADALLRHCPQLRILATSREALRIDGEQILQVPPLAVPSLRLLKPIRPELVQTITPYPSVQLFLERARAVQSGFRLTDRNAPSVVQICYLLDGLPLAIELAAARVSLLAPDQIAARLDHAITLLKGGSRVALERHQTLRAAIDWSHQLLEPAEQVLFRRLAVFFGGWTLEAAVSVCADSGEDELELLEHLNGLVQKSLTLADRDEDGNVVRYRLLETVRQYAAEKLAESGEAEETARRHRNWVLELAERAEPELQGPNQGEWLDKLELEHGNIRVALDYCAEEPTGVFAALELAASLFRFWYLRGYTPEGLAALNRLLSGPHQDGAPTVLRCKASIAAGNLAIATGDYDVAEEMFQRSLQWSDELGDATVRATSISNLGRLARDRDEIGVARERWQSAVNIYQELGDKTRLAPTLLNLAMLEREQQNLEAAYALLLQGKSLIEAIGDTFLLSVCLQNLGEVCQARGEIHLMKHYTIEAVRVNLEIRNYSSLPHWFRNLAVTLASSGRWDEATRMWRITEKLQQRLGIQLAPFLEAAKEEQIQLIRDLYSKQGEADFAPIPDSTEELCEILRTSILTV